MEKVVFQTLSEVVLGLDPNTVLKMEIVKNNSKNTVNLQLREFKVGGDYIGPTKNGLTYRIKSLDDIELLQSHFNLFVEKAKDEFNKL